MNMPNFLVIGAAKAGTTSLYHYLKQHPQIYMSPHKEPRFFALEGRPIDFHGPGDRARFNFVTDLEHYQALFEGVGQETAIGEASPWYLYVDQAPERIKYHIPDAKLIAILRDPVERAYSNYLHALREGLEPLDDFVKAMDAEEARIRDHWSYRWHYKQKGFYFGQIKRYFDYFDKDNVRIYLYEDFVSNCNSVLQDIFEFIEVEKNVNIDISTKYNVSNRAKCKYVERFLNSDSKVKSFIKHLIYSQKLRTKIKGLLIDLNAGKKRPLSKEVRSRYVTEYREDILRLQDLLQKDLSNWLQV